MVEGHKGEYAFILCATGNGLKGNILASAVDDQVDFLRADDERIK